MDKIDHLMAEKNENNKNSQKGQVTPKKIKKKLSLDVCGKTNSFKHLFPVVNEGGVHVEAGCVEKLMGTLRTPEMGPYVMGSTVAARACKCRRYHCGSSI